MAWKGEGERLLAEQGLEPANPSIPRPVFASPIHITFVLLYVALVGIRLAKETSHLAGDSWQQGGTVLVDKDGNILYQVGTRKAVF